MKVLQIVYSGIGGNSVVAFSLIQGDIKKVWNSSIVFTGKEKVPKGFVNFCKKLSIKYFNQGNQKSYFLREFYLFFKLIKQKPDIIINPHAIPSRMTIAQLLECIMSKACLSIGTCGNSTAFMYKNKNERKDDIASILQKSGYDKHGNEIMYNPRTGEQINTNIFIGPTYYQRLKHMVQDKIHSRSANGPIILLTRQPAEGRAREGGLRLGEMEVECNWGHGSLHFLKERLMECADNYRLFICKNCGNIANVNPTNNIYICKVCNNSVNYSQIRIPYACKLLFQEIQSLSINTKFFTQ